LPVALPVARPIEAEDGVPPARPIGDDLPHPMLLMWVPRGEAGWDVFVFLVFAFAIWLGAELTVGLMIGGSAGGAGGAGSGMRWARLAGSVAAGFGMVAAVGFMIRRRGLGWSSIGICARSRLEVVLFGIAAVAGAYLVMGVTLGLIAALSSEGFQSATENVERIQEAIPPVHWGWLAGLSLCVGIYEEVVFRGFLMTRLWRATGSMTAAVLLNSALFAALHGGTQNTVVIAPLFGIAVMWSMLTIWQRSLIPAMIGHVLFNAMQLIGLYLQTDRASWERVFEEGAAAPSMILLLGSL
jgi:membrane protease YdiL (CAAX protease family)